MKENNLKNSSVVRQVMSLTGLIIFALAGFLVLTKSAEMQTGSQGIQSPETALTLGKLAYQQANFTTSGSIYYYINTITADGTGNSTLTNNQGLPIFFDEPAWSPDGTKLAYDLFGDIVVANADGSNQIIIANSPAKESNPSWSATSKIAYERDNQIWTMNADGSNQMQFTAISQPMPLAPAWSPDGSKLAFASNGEIYVINADGTNERRVTNNSIVDADPAWSPDGMKIAYGKGSTGIAVINLDGTNERNLTNAQDGKPAWSSDNTKIAFVRRGAEINGIYLMSPDGSNQFNLVADFPYQPGRSETNNPAWQPIAAPPNSFIISGRITRVGASLSGATVTLSGSATASVTTDSNGNYRFENLTAGGSYTVSPSLTSHVFSPQSRTFNNLTVNQIVDFTATQTCSTPNCATNGKIVFVKNNDIYTMSPDGLNQINLTNTSAIENEPSHSPDGSKIIFVSNRDGNDEIYTMNTDGSGVVRLTNNPATDIYPSYSPNGTKIVFASNRDGNDEIYTMNADGTNPVRLTNNQVSDGSPRFSPDGSKIVYSGGAVNIQTYIFPSIFVMNADGTNPIQITHPVGYYDYTPAYSPDGTKIIFARYDGGPFTSTIYVMNTDGSNQAVLKDGYNYKPTYSPDGAKILFASKTSLNTQNYFIYTMNSDGSGAINLAVGDRPSWQQLRRQTRTAFDFDGDGRADIAVFRPSNGFWYQLRSQNNAFNALQFGQSNDKLAPADYDGDGRADIAVFRDNVPGAGDKAYFYILTSSDNSFRPVQFGTQNDVSVSGDWDGDGKADLAVYRSAAASGGQSYFFYRPSSIANSDFTAIPWGTAGDKPLVGDFDGDGKLDAAVFRPSNGVWYILQSSNNQLVQQQFGAATDIPTPADFYGDGKTNLAVFRPSNGTWYVARPNGVPARDFDSVQFGSANDKPAPADYDGDGKADIVVYRPSNGTWYLLRSTMGFIGVQFGTAEDRPVSNSFFR